jgi:tyrosine-specific transport protein
LFPYFSGDKHSTVRLAKVNWTLAPFSLGILVSAFHFHNIIPTLSHSLNKNQKATRLAITVGMIIGLIINVTWLLIVTGSLPIHSSNSLNLTNAFCQNLPATIPMAYLLHSRLFTQASLTFGVLAITASYLANGTGLFGFMRDLSTNYLKTDKKWIVSLLAFLPPLLITLIYPKIFIDMLDIVGGIGETVLFLILPAIILIRLQKRKTLSRKNHILTKVLAYIMLSIGCFILVLISLEKLNLYDLSQFLHCSFL